MNHDLLIEEFNNEEIFKNFTEPALLNAKSRYFWNFVKSRIFPLNNQVSSSDTSKLTQVSVKNDRCCMFKVTYTYKYIFRKNLKELMNV